MSEQMTVLVTGSSTGIGKATCKLFQERNWNVVATMRRPDDEKELPALENVLVTRLDVTDAASIQAAVKAGIDRFGRIDVLVNNAGFGSYGPLEATSMEKVERQFSTNVLGLLAMTKALLPHFRANRSGVIVNISSVGGKVAYPLGTLYHGTKFAVEGLSEALSFEMGTVGVRVKIVEPGAIKTDFMKSFDFNNDETLTEYQDVVGKLMKVAGPMMENGAEPTVVAEVIYQAATDGTDQLRYTAGDDAEPLMAKRKAEDDTTFLRGMRERFDL